MTVKVVNKEDQANFVIYHNVDFVSDCFDDNGNYCHQLHIADETATFPAAEWAIYKWSWVAMF